MKALLGKKVDIRCATAADSMRACLGGADVRAGRFDPLEPARLQGRPHAQGHGPSRFPPYPGLFAPKGTLQDVKDKWTAIRP